MRLALIVALIVALLGACSGPEPVDPRGTVVTVDGRAIQGQAILLRALRQYAGAEPRAWGAILTRLVDDEIDLQLMAAEASKQKLSISEDAIDRAVAETARRYPAHTYRQRLDELALQPADRRTRIRLRLLAQALLAREAEKTTVPSDMIEAWKQAHPEQEKVVVRHLLAETEAEAEEALTLYRKKRRGFAELVRRFSSAPEAARGGLLPPYARQEFPPVFDAAFDLKPGEVSAALKSEHGWHLILLERRFKAGPPEDDLARRDILRTQEGELQRRLIARLRAQAEIAKVPGAITALAKLLEENR